MSDGLVRWFDAVPALRRAVLLVALEGFVDAGGAGSTAGLFLRHRWRSDLVARFDRDAFLDYRARRPTATLDDGELRRVDWPDLELFAAAVEGPRDALLLLGPEPDTRWEAWCAAVLDVCRATGVETVLTLGAYPAAAPHTRPVRVARARNAVGGDVRPAAADVPAYTGPVGAATVLQHVLGEAGLPTVGLWAEVPHYIAATPHPGAALSLVRTVADALGTSIDTTELEAAARIHREQVDEAVAEHTDAAEMVAALEAHVDSGGGIGDLPSGDDLAAEIERFLRTRE